MDVLERVLEFAAGAPSVSFPENGVFTKFDAPNLLAR
jgi:hypothetical protein